MVKLVFKNAFFYIEKKSAVFLGNLGNYEQKSTSIDQKLRDLSIGVAIGRNPIKYLPHPFILPIHHTCPRG